MYPLGSYPEDLPTEGVFDMWPPGRFARGIHTIYSFARSSSMAGHGHSDAFFHDKLRMTKAVGSTDASLLVGLESHCYCASFRFLLGMYNGGPSALETRGGSAAAIT